MKYAPFAPDAHGDAVAAVLRTARPEDAHRIAELQAQRDGGDAGAVVERIRLHLEAAAERVVVAEVDARVVAYARTEWIDPGPDAVAVPAGWYLSGIVVAPEVRRRGIGRRLVAERLARLQERGASEVFYMANPRNLATFALHAPFGFEELTRDFHLPGTTFDGGVGVLLRARFHPGTARRA